MLAQVTVVELLNHAGLLPVESGQEQENQKVDDKTFFKMLVVFPGNCRVAQGGFEEGDALWNIEMVPVRFLSGLTEEKAQFLESRNQARAQAGEIQSCKVGLTFDKDFGSGYRYEVIVEETEFK